MFPNLFAVWFPLFVIYIVPWVYQRLYWGRVHLCHIGWFTTIQQCFLDVSSIKDRAKVVMGSVRHSTIADQASLYHTHVYFSYVTEHAKLDFSHLEGCDVSGHVFLADCTAYDCILQGDVFLSKQANLIDLHWWRDVP